MRNWSYVYEWLKVASYDMMGESQHSNIPVKISERKYNLQLSDEKKNELTLANRKVVGPSSSTCAGDYVRSN